MSIDMKTRNTPAAEIDRTGAKRVVKICARVLGICAAAFVLLARDGIGPPYLDSVGKALFWSGGVLVFVFFLNQDVLRLTSGKLFALLFFALQMFFVFYWFWKAPRFELHRFDSNLLHRVPSFYAPADARPKAA